MKWFKHQSGARNDEKISRLEDRAGLEGYGFYFKMLEIVAEIMDSTDKHEVTYSMSRWGRQTNITTKKFLTLVQCCADVGLMLVQRGGDDITVRIPNILKHRDNHTKNLQATCKQELDKEVDKEQIEKEIKKVHQAPAKAVATTTFTLPDWIDKSQWDLWLKTRKKKMMPEQMQAQIDRLAEWRNSGLDHCGALANSALNGYAGLFLPDAKKSSPANRQSSNEQIKAAAFQRLFGEKEIESV